MIHNMHTCYLTAIAFTIAWNIRACICVYLAKEDSSLICLVSDTLQQYNAIYKTPKQ